MTLQNQKKLSRHICRLLKIHEITWSLGRTPKGNLGLTFSENIDDFVISLDSVPLLTDSVMTDENNMELKRMIAKYFFAEEPTPFEKTYQAATAYKDSIEVTNSVVTKEITESAQPKKRGRPAKNAIHKTKKSS